MFCFSVSHGFRYQPQSVLRTFTTCVGVSASHCPRLKSLNFPASGTMTPKAIASTKMQGSFADFLPTFEWDLAIKDLIKELLPEDLEELQFGEGESPTLLRRNILESTFPQYPKDVLST